MEFLDLVWPVVGAVFGFISNGLFARASRKKKKQNEEDFDADGFFRAVTEAFKETEILAKISRIEGIDKSADALGHLRRRLGRDIDKKETSIAIAFFRSMARALK